MIVERTLEGKALARRDPDSSEDGPCIYSNKQIDYEIVLKEHWRVKDMTDIIKARCYGQAEGSDYYKTYYDGHCNNTHQM